MSEPQTPDEILDHYERIQDEAVRLQEGPDGTMEAIRTLELLGRFLPAPPARILDVGGGAGFYAVRLTAQGHEVHLIDPVPRHVEEASRPAGEFPTPASACLGDARSVDHPDGSFRVMKDGGLLAAAGITRFTSAIDGLDRGLLDDPAFVEIMERDLAEGQHRNPTGNPSYFTTAFFHHPYELKTEVAEAGFEDVSVYAIEGISWAAPDLADRLADPAKREIVLDIVRRTESEPSLLGASPHLLAIGRR